MVQSCKRFVAAISGAAILFSTLPVMAASPILPLQALNASCSIVSAPSVVKPGASFAVRVKVVNTGNATWSKNNYFLSYLRSSSYGTIALRDNVKFNQSTTFDFTTIAPSTGSAFTFTSQMMDSRGTKFGKVCTAQITVQSPEVKVLTRSVFYNNSSFDRNTVFIDEIRDPNAIATDKQPLFNGQTATFANYTSYSKGINGVVIDVANLASSTLSITSDFTFRVGNDNFPSSWKFPSPPTMMVRHGAGVSGSDRIWLMWPDNVIQKQWLQVTLKANAHTGLKTDDVFYFGNAVAEIGNSTLNAFVDGTDFAGSRDNQTKNSQITNKFDFNRDGKVDAADMTIASTNATNFLTALKLITPSATPPRPPSADVALVKQGPTSVMTGTGYSYRIDVKNAGPDMAQNVQVMDAIPAGLQYTGSSLGSACALSGSSTVVCSIGSMTLNAQQTILLNVTVPKTMACGSGADLKNIATVSGTTADANLTNNSNSSAPVVTKVACPARPLGDVTGDGTVSSLDTAKAQRHVLGLETLPASALPYADVDMNGKITIADAYLIAGRVMGLITLPAVYGDVTGNGGLSNMDTSQISRFALGLEQPTSQQGYLADVNVDGKIDQNDVDLISKAVVGFIELPVLCGNANVDIAWGEQCDDGNTVNGDSCSATCQLEPAARAAMLLGCSQNSCDLKKVVPVMHEVVGSLFQSSATYDVTGDGKVTQADLAIYVGVVDASNIKWEYKAFTILDKGDFDLTQADADAVFPLIVKALYTVNATYDVTEQSDTINQFDIALYISVADMFGIKLNAPIESHYHSADYDKNWIINGTEMNRVLSYWRAGAYYVNAGGSDGYAAGVGSHAGTPHSADTNGDWVIDTAEKDWVETLWLSAGYRWDASLQKFMPQSPVCGNKFVEEVAGEQCDDGGKTGGDGCSATCQIEVVTTPAKLDIAVKSTVSTNFAVANQKNITLLRFESRASNHDVLLNKLIFSPMQSGVNGANYTLWVDTNADGIVDTILQKGVSVQNSQVIFDKIGGDGYVVPTSTAITFEVHADVASSLSGNPAMLSLKFATSGSGYVTAENLSDGAPLVGIKTDGTCTMTSCQISVTDVPSTVFTLKSSGDLFVTKSTTPVRSRQLLGGTLGDDVLRLKFHAEYEDIDVAVLVLSATDTNASRIANNVDRLELYEFGATIPFAVATIGGCGSSSIPPHSFCAPMTAQEFIVPQGRDVEIVVRPRMRTDSDGAVSGDIVKFFVDASAGVHARGQVSSNVLSSNDGDAISDGEIFIGTDVPFPSLQINGTKNIVVLSKITSITNASPDANGTAIPTGAARNIGQFKFSAAVANNGKYGLNKVSINSLIFNVNATNVDLDGGKFNLFNKMDPTMTAPCSVQQSSGSSALLVTCAGLIASLMQTQIDQGTNATFVLQADIQNAKVNNGNTSTLQVSLQNFSDMNASSFSPTGSHIDWQDNDAGSSTPFLWLDYPEISISGTSYAG